VLKIDFRQTAVVCNYATHLRSNGNTQILKHEETIMKKLILILFSIISITAFSQSNSIKKLDKLLNKSNEVTNISFSYSSQDELNYLLDRLMKFPNLKSLNLRNTSREKPFMIDKRLIEYTNLTSLSIMFADLSTCLSQLDKLVNLESLLISNCDLKEIPESILKLRNLNYLCFDYNNIDSIPDLISNLEYLSILYLKNNSFTHFPSELLALDNLTELHIGNEFTSENFLLPGSRKVSYNRFILLPDNMIKLKKLNKIFLPKDCKTDNIKKFIEEYKITVKITS
jgi:Leucine-rich repeat (LRR) protein